MRRITEVSRVEAETRENTGSFYLNSGVLTPLAPHRVAYWYSYQLPPVAGFFPLRALCEPRVRTSENNPASILAATDFLSASCSSKLHPIPECFSYRIWSSFQLLSARSHFHPFHPLHPLHPCKLLRPLRCIGLEPLPKALQTVGNTQLGGREFVCREGA